jgi:hypothetical protein
MIKAGIGLLKRLWTGPVSKEPPIRLSEFMKMSKVCFVGTGDTGINAINAIIKSGSSWCKPQFKRKE